MRIKIFTVSAVLFGAVAALLASDCRCEAFRYDSKGKRDPFFPLAGVARSNVVGLEGIVSITDVRLEGISTGPGGRRTAFMNGKSIKEGDRVGAVEIKKIEQNAVRLTISGAEYSISLPKEGG